MNQMIKLINIYGDIFRPANLIQVNAFENEDVIETYEQAASEGSFNDDEIF